MSNIQYWSSGNFKGFVLQMAVLSSIKSFIAFNKKPKYSLVNRLRTQNYGDLDSELNIPSKTTSNNITE